MSLNLNKVILSGRMVADPELKQTNGGTSVTSFRMAVNRRPKSGEQTEADFFTVTAWMGTAEFVSKYFRKGSAICVCGRIQNRSWTDQQGQKRYATDIIADEAYFAEAPRTPENATGATEAATQPKYTDNKQTPDTMNFESIQTGDDLPF